MFEKQNNTTNVSNSATDAIMWLKRGLTFVKEFLKNVGAGEKNLTKALQVLAKPKSQNLKDNKS